MRRLILDNASHSVETRFPVLESGDISHLSKSRGRSSRGRSTHSLGDPDFRSVQPSNRVVVSRVLHGKLTAIVYRGNTAVVVNRGLPRSQVTIPYIVWVPVRFPGNRTVFTVYRIIPYDFRKVGTALFPYLEKLNEKDPTLHSSTADLLGAAAKCYYTVTIKKNSS